MTSETVFYGLHDIFFPQDPGQQSSFSLSELLDSFDATPAYPLLEIQLIGGETGNYQCDSNNAKGELLVCHIQPTSDVVGERL